MPQTYKPLSPLPKPLKGSETGTFAHYSIVKRLPEIGQRILKENNFPQKIHMNLQIFFDDIPWGKIRNIQDKSAPDTLDWLKYTQPYREKNWLDVPWFFVETYFYRRILEVTGYFQPGALHKFDPFSYQKRQGFEASTLSIQDLSENLKAWIDKSGQREMALRRILTTGLWGNQADLSLWPANQSSDKPDHQSSSAAQEHILVNETEKIIKHLLYQQTNSPRMDIIADNAGFEIVTDLGMADFLLSREIVDSVFIHLKAHPTFVSDATVGDAEFTVKNLSENRHDETRQFGERLIAHMNENRLKLKVDFFWNSPLSMWEMPTYIREVLGISKLVVSKGDANYRRLLGDRHWQFDVPFEKILRYFPAPLVTLRTLKSEVAAGLQHQQLEILNKIDPEWMINGKWGVIQSANIE